MNVYVIFLIPTDVEPYVDPCDPPPCLNGGVCSHNGNKFSCDCRPTEYTGPTCNVSEYQIVNADRGTQYKYTYMFISMWVSELYY